MTPGQVQAGVAVALALAVHLGAFALGPEAGGAAASGAGGADLLTLQAADGAMAALVAEWDRPPPTPAPAATAMTPPDAEDDLPLRPLPADAPPVAPRAAVPLSPPTVDAAPVAEAAPPAPAPLVRPKTRPEKRAEPVAAPRPDRQDAAPQAARKAAGAGGGAQAGEGGQARAATLSQARIDDLTAGWGAQIRARIEKRKRYPSDADGATGSVTVRLTVTRAGTLAGVAVSRSSGHDALDAAAVKAVQSAGKFPAAPKGLDQESYSFTLAMKFAR